MVGESMSWHHQTIPRQQECDVRNGHMGLTGSSTAILNHSEIAHLYLGGTLSHN
jgi:hypothetical protein